MGKIMIVEGKTDKERLALLLDEPVEIICSYGTLSSEKLEEWLGEFSNDEVYILTDADEPGDKLRRQIHREFPNAIHLYTHRMYREVACTPVEVLVNILERAHFAVKGSAKETEF